MKGLRFRHVYMGIGSVLVILLWLLTDPDTGVIEHLPFGASTVVTLLILLKSILYVGVLHYSRKALVDYLNLKVTIEQALKTPEGSGYVVVGIGLMMIAIAIVMYAATAA